MTGEGRVGLCPSRVQRLSCQARRWTERAIVGRERILAAREARGDVRKRGSRGEALANLMVVCYTANLLGQLSIYPILNKNDISGRSAAW